MKMRIGRGRGAGRRATVAATFVAACVGGAGTVSTAYGQTAYFSLQGSFAAVDDKHDFNINLSRSVSNAETLWFQTFAREGGTNAAGDVIPANASGIDSVLTLFDSANASRGADDDHGAVLDSMLTWTGSDVNLNPSPLPSGNYRLNMFEFNNDAAGPWATDLVGPADAMTFTGATATGTSTVSSLKFGTTGAGANVATFNSASNFNVTGVLGVGTTGNGTLNVNAGSFTVGGVTTVNANGRINVSGGTFTANNNVTLNGGKLIHTSGTFNVGSGRTLNANTGAQVSFTGSYSVTNGTAFSIQSGSSMSTSSYLDIGSVNSGTVTVDGAGSTLNVATGLALSDAVIGFAGAAGSLNVSNQASATYGTPALRIGSDSTAASGTVFISGAGTLSAKNVTIGNGTASTGTVTVTGSGSTVTQSGSSTLTLGAATGATGTGTINLQSSGVFTTGAGAIAINKTGTVNVAGGTFNANGDVTLNGGKLLHTSGTFNLAAGKSLTASNAGQVGLVGSHSVNEGRSVTVQSGSSLTLAGGFLSVGDGGGGTLLVTGAGSTLTSTPPVDEYDYWGAFGGTANITVSDQAVVNMNGGVSIGDSDDAAATSGTLNVTSGGQFTTRQIAVAVGNAATGVVNVTGTNSKITATGVGLGGSLFVGANGTSTSTGTINVQTAGNLTASALSQIDKTGTINIAGGTFTANGDVNVDGGKLLRDSAGSFGLASGKALTATAGGQVSFTGPAWIENGTTFTIQSGASLSSTSSFDVGALSNATLVVTGLGSSFVTGSSGSQWGGNGGTSSVTIADQATATLGSALFIAASSNPATNATVNVTSGAQMTARSIAIGNSSAGTGVVTVTGTNSKITQIGSSNLTVGSAGAGTLIGTLNVTSSGTFITGTGLTTILSRGKIDNAGGTFTAANVLNDGTLASASTTNTGAITGTGTTNVGGGTLTATGGIRQGTLMLSGKAVVAQSAPFPTGDSAAVSRVSTLLIANNGAAIGSRIYFGTLDLKNNDLIVDYTAGNGPATLASVRDMIRAAYASGAWTGAGLTSTSATANPSHTLGVADNAVLNRTSFDGLTTNGNQVLVKYTYAGDANLDGKVDIGDLGLLAGAWQQLSGKSWFDGDFTFDGAVNIGDLGLLAGNWQKGTAGNPSGPLMTFSEALAQFSAFDGVAVPEPAGVALAALAVAGMLGGRRRRR